MVVGNVVVVLVQRGGRERKKKKEKGDRVCLYHFWPLRLSSSNIFCTSSA